MLQNIVLGYNETPNTITLNPPANFNGGFNFDQLQKFSMNIVILKVVSILETCSVQYSTE
jgi:hypothetical protein